MAGDEALPLALERFFIASLKTQARIVTGLTAVAKVARRGSLEANLLRPRGETDHEDDHVDARAVAAMVKVEKHRRPYRWYDHGCYDA